MGEKAKIPYQLAFMDGLHICSYMSPKDVLVNDMETIKLYCLSSEVIAVSMEKCIL